MNYAGMPQGMWLLFRRSFRRQLTDTLGINRKAAAEITGKAKSKYREIIEAERPIVFCSFSPQFRFAPRKDKESMLENMLREHGYREIDRSQYRYMIYIPQSSNRQSSNGK